MNGSLIEWQTRQLARAIVSTVPVEKGKRNPLQGLLDEVRLWPEERSEPSDPPPAGREPPPGSTERFLGTFSPALDRNPRE